MKWTKHIFQHNKDVLHSNYLRHNDTPHGVCRPVRGETQPWTAILGTSTNIYIVLLCTSKTCYGLPCAYSALVHRCRRDLPLFLDMHHCHTGRAVFPDQWLVHCIDDVVQLQHFLTGVDTWTFHSIFRVFFRGHSTFEIPFTSRHLVASWYLFLYFPVPFLPFPGVRLTFSNST